MDRRSVCMCESPLAGRWNYLYLLFIAPGMDYYIPTYLPLGRYLLRPPYSAPMSGCGAAKRASKQSMLSGKRSSDQKSRHLHSKQLPCRCYRPRMDYFFAKHQRKCGYEDDGSFLETWCGAKGILLPCWSNFCLPRGTGTLAKGCPKQ